MIHSFIAYKYNNNSLQPLLKVQQGFKNSVEIPIELSKTNNLSFFLYLKSDKSKKGSITKIDQYKVQIPKNVDKNNINNKLKIVATIPENGEFSTSFSYDGGKTFSTPEITKFDASIININNDFPYGSFVYKKAQEISDFEVAETLDEEVEDDLLPEKAAAHIMPATKTNLNLENDLTNDEPQESDNLNVAENISDTDHEDFSAKRKQPKRLQKNVKISPDQDEYYDLAEQASKVRAPLSLKLIAIITLIVSIALGSITLLVSYFVTGDVRISAEENNMTINFRAYSETKNRLNDICNNTQMMLELVANAGNNSILENQITSSFFLHNNAIAAVYIPEVKTIENSKFFLQNGITSEMAQTMLLENEHVIQNALGGSSATLNVSPYFGINIDAMIMPIEWNLDDAPNALIILFSNSVISDIFSSQSTNTSFIVNNDGNILFHPDEELVLANADLSSSQIVDTMKKDSELNKQIIFTDDDGVEFFGAFRKISDFGITVLTVIESKTVFEAIKATTRRNIYLSIAVLFLSGMFIWFFAKSITTPIKALAAASKKIADGEFKVNLLSHTRDEIGLLTNSFKNMGTALDTFGRFTNKMIAVKAMRGEITLGGEAKNATLFFSDIRSFTAISEKLSAEEVVLFLNDYMTRMVTCVEKTGGTVDKFIGDAVMAHWGAASTTGSEISDARSSVRAALMMRAALREFNIGRGGDKKPIIKIGCGINSGPIVAGQIGSIERMEYTCIGDTVNFASRTESLNKPLGTDILITENTYELIKDEVLVEQMPAVTVKGKEKPVHMYAVINMPNATDIPGAGIDGPKTLQEVREILGIPTPDLAGVNLDEEEKKYKIQGK